jgi:fatty-acyl-CoA synthase
VIYGVPTMFIAELDHTAFDNFDLSSLRTGIMAGAPCPIEVMRKVVDRMGAREMTIAYGLTEASPVITSTRAEDSLERRVSTVGRALPHVEVKIAEPGRARARPASREPARAGSW